MLKPLIFMSLIATLLGGRFFVNLITTSEASNAPTSIASDQVSASDRQLPNYRPAEPAEYIGNPVEELLQAEIDSFALKNPNARVGISIQSLVETDPFKAQINADQQFSTASLYKTLAAYHVLRRVDNGELSLKQNAEGEHDLEACIRRAISKSDNPCGVVLQRLARPQIADADQIEFGYTRTTLAGVYPHTTANDQNLLLSDIYTGNRLSKESHELLLSALENQTILDRTPNYDNATLYLKTGDIKNVVNSSAIIEGDKRVYSINLLTDDWDILYTDKYQQIDALHRSIHEILASN